MLRQWRSQVSHVGLFSINIKVKLIPSPCAFFSLIREVVRQLNPYIDYTLITIQRAPIIHNAPDNSEFRPSQGTHYWHGNIAIVFREQAGIDLYLGGFIT